MDEEAKKKLLEEMEKNPEEFERIASQLLSLSKKKVGGL